MLIMETENNKQAKIIETSELPERIGDIPEEKSSTDNWQDEIWAQIGDMTLTEGIKQAWICVKKIKVKQVVWGASLCIGIFLGGFILYYISNLFLSLLWTIANECYDMVDGKNNGYLYSLFDGHLYNSIPFSLIVAIIVGLVANRHKLIHMILDFLMLLSILEIWNYWHIEYGVNETLGGLCFIIMFLIVPILYIAKFFISIFTDNEQDNEAKENNESASNTIVRDSN